MRPALKNRLQLAAFLRLRQAKARYWAARDEYQERLYQSLEDGQPAAQRRAVARAKNTVRGLDGALRRAAAACQLGVSSRARRRRGERATRGAGSLEALWAAGGLEAGSAGDSSPSQLAAADDNNDLDLRKLGTLGTAGAGARCIAPQRPPAAPSGRSLPTHCLTPRLVAQRPQAARHARAGIIVI